ncbi:DnaJ-domain-containing protein [Plenodomus tracheiphilus IPT5]|uniref:DnaJ-domain-containing protein n=1 Tax=Plenodomus tracheiphilus IPT5 TaxID=1408161 RepID=A0A6A7AZU4_9PLEO|nr:DnaJ-domain-containing protein [Plenodomus tracheiphilus IPT5]
MDNQVLRVLYEECRAKGYTRSEARARCDEFEAHFLESRRRRDPYDFADMAETLPQGTEEPRRAERDHREHHPSPRYANKKKYYQEELQSPRTPTPRKQGHHFPTTEPLSPGPRGKYYKAQPHSHGFPDQAPPSARYFAEEHRPRREPSSRAHEYNPFDAASPRPKRTYTTYDAAPRPHAGRAHTDIPRYNTTERAPSDMPWDSDYRSARDSPPPRRSARAHSPSPPPPSPPPSTANKPKVDLYMLLGIQRSATTDHIKRAHRNLSLKWHPDRCAEVDKELATEKMAQINQAKDVLSDVNARRFYDQTGCLPGLLG